MKRIIRTGVVVAMMLMGVSTFAKGSEPFVKVSAAGNKEFTLFINEVNAPAVVVSLKDMSGNTLYKEVLLSKDKYSKLYDLNALSAGSYMLEVDEDTRTISWSLEISSTGVDIDRNSKKKYFKPQIVNDKNTLGLSFFNKNNQSLTVRLYNDKNMLVFTEELPAELVMMKQYDLSQFEKGRHTVVLKTGNRSFEKVIDVK